MISKKETREEGMQFVIHIGAIVVCFCSTVFALEENGTFDTQYYHCNKNAIAAAQKLIEEKKLSPCNALYQGYCELDKIFKQEEAMSHEVVFYIEANYIDMLYSKELRNVMSNKKNSLADIKLVMRGLLHEKIKKVSQMQITLEPTEKSDGYRELFLKNQHIGIKKGKSNVYNLHEKNNVIAFIWLNLKINRFVRSLDVKNNQLSHEALNPNATFAHNSYEGGL